MMYSYYIKFILLAMLSLAFIGCSGGSKNLYYWGHYEESIYSMYLEPGKLSTTDEILRLEEQIEKAKASGQLVPPGLHAHIGYLYYNDGDYNMSVNHFQIEKNKFPESAGFIDGLLERMKK
ncbi:MAG: DUF4810 domain-containing protein [Desulfobacteraceae bacterium]